MKLNFKKYGNSGEVVIILHGLLGSLDNWHTIAVSLSKRFTVFTLDARNHGKSPHNNVFTYEAMADDVLEFMNGQKISSLHLVGHSMGGKTAMQFSLSHSELVNKLVVVDISPKTYNSFHDEILETLITFPINNIRSRNEADDLLKEKISDFSVRQFLLKNLVRNENGKFKWKMNLKVIHKGYLNIAKAIESNQPYIKPTLFIRGEKSNYIQENDTVTIKTLFPIAEIITIANAGHWVHADAPKEFTETLFNFLRK